MDFFYDGQIRRYVTQFMRIFIGFKYQAGDGEQRHVPVMYGDLTRQVAGIIRDNSENKMPTVPRMSCYITGLELDTSRLADATFVSKVQIRERDYEVVNNQRVYGIDQGAGYTVERLMPTPFKLRVKTDIWTSNTDQKLQLLEQILVLFNPSLDVQTTDNYVDWTSLTSIFLTSTNFTSRSIPAGTESDIDICSLEFEMPIYITPPAKVKKLGVVRAIVNNMFTNTGDAVNIHNLVYNEGDVKFTTEYRRYGVILIKADNGEPLDYYISVVDAGQAVIDAGLDLPPEKIGKKIDWNIILDAYGGYKEGVSRISFTQPGGGIIVFTIAINPLDPTLLVATIDADTLPGNTDLNVGTYPNQTAYVSARSSSKGTIDAIVNPYNFNPLKTYGSQSNFPVGLRYLMLDDVNSHLALKDVPNISTNIIDTDIDFYRIVRPNQRESAGLSNLPKSYRNIYQTKVYINGGEVSFTEVENGGEFSTFGVVGGTSYRTASGKYRILLDSFPPLTDAGGNPTVVKYVIERYTYPDWYTEGDDPDTMTVETDVYLAGKPERSSGPEAWKNLDGSDTWIKANAIIEWTGNQWVPVFEPEDEYANTYITNLRTGIQYKWDGIQWLKSFEGEYLPGSWRLELNP